MTRLPSTCRSTSPLRAATLLLFVFAMFLNGTVALADPMSLAPTGSSTMLMVLQMRAGPEAARLDVVPMSDHTRAEPCERTCDPAQGCPTDCVASCVATGSSTVCALAAGVDYAWPSAQALAPGSPGTRAPAGPTAPPLFRPPIV